MEANDEGEREGQETPFRTTAQSHIWFRWVCEQLRPRALLAPPGLACWVGEAWLAPDASLQVSGMFSFEGFSYLDIGDTVGK